MRAVTALGLVLALAACSGDPRSYGITGPGPPPPPPSAGDDTGTPLGTPTSGSYYGPSTGPIMGGGSGFWGYN